MNRNLLTLLSTLLYSLILYGCSSEMLENDKIVSENNKKNECVFIIPDFQLDDTVSSRTSFTLTQNGASLRWLQGDTIGILPDKGAQVYFVIDELDSENTNKASFDGGAWGLKIGNNYAAYYPFIGDIYLQRTQVPVDYTGQVHDGKVKLDKPIAHLSAYDYMAAQAVEQTQGNLNFEFSHLGALVEVKFKVPSAGPVKKFCLKANDKIIPVRGTFDLSKNPVTIVSTAEDKTDQLVIEIENLTTTNDNEEVSVFFMLPPMETKTNMLNATVVCGVMNQSYSLKIKTEKLLEAGKCYSLDTEVSTDVYPESLLLPDNIQTFSSNIVNALNKLGGNKLKFVAKSSMTSDFMVYTDKNGVKAYAVKNGDWLEIHTYAEEFKTGKDISYMFNGDKAFPKFKLLREIDLSAFNTEETTKMYYMFGGCSLLTTISFSSFNTISITDMGGLLMGCSSLESLTFGDNFDTSSVIKMSQMFSGCSSLTSLDLSNFNVANVIDMESMFSECTSLKSITFGENFDTSSVTDMSFMFRNCSSLTSLDLSNFDVVNVIDMGSMFSGCSSLESITFGDAFNASSVTDMRSMFNGCSSLTSLDLSNFNVANVIEMESMFSGCSSLESIIFGENFNTSSVTNMSSMFYECTSLTSLDLSNIDVDNVIDMGSMFSKCNSLKSITFGENFDTSSVTDMSFMFNRCKSLKVLDLSKFNTINVMNMQWMFLDCESLMSLDLSNFNTSLVTNMEQMFGDCSLLTSLDLSNFSFEKKPNCSSMFSSTGYKSINKPIHIYVTSDGKAYLEGKSTNINSNYAKLVVKDE